MNKVLILLAVLIASTLCTSEIDINPNEDSVEQNSFDTGGENDQDPDTEDDEDVESSKR